MLENPNLPCPHTQSNAFHTMLEELDERMRRPRLAEIRQAWVALHGKAQLERVSCSELVHQVAKNAFGCSAADDDSLVLWRIRGPVLSESERICYRGHRDRDLNVRLEVALSSLMLESGDTLVTYHDHVCATDCSAGAERFLYAVRVN